MIQARVLPNQFQVPPSPRPWPAAPPRGDPGCQGQDSATPRPRPAGPKPHPPHAVPSRGPTALVGELTPQPRPRTRRWEPGVGHRVGLPASFAYLPGEPGRCWRRHLSPGGCRSNPRGGGGERSPEATERTRAPT